MAQQISFILAPRDKKIIFCRSFHAYNDYLTKKSGEMNLVIFQSVDESRSFTINFKGQPRSLWDIFNMVKDEHDGDVFEVSC